MRTLFPLLTLEKWICNHRISNKTRNRKINNMKDKNEKNVDQWKSNSPHSQFHINQSPIKVLASLLQPHSHRSICQPYVSLSQYYYNSWWQLRMHRDWISFCLFYYGWGKKRKRVLVLLSNRKEFRQCSIRRYAKRILVFFLSPFSMFSESRDHCSIFISQSCRQHFTQVSFQWRIR